MAHIDDVPEEVTPAGQEFDYSDSTPLAKVELVNAPLDPDHQNIGVNRAAYDLFIDTEIAAGRAYVQESVNLINPEHDLVLPIAYAPDGMFYNYGRVTIQGRRWYVFYTPTYQNKTNTRFVADLDEVASFDWTLGYSMIERGHVAVAASQNDTYGDQYLTAPEPILADPVRGIFSADLLGTTPGGWTVLVTSANDLRGHTGAKPFWERHVRADEISGAAGLASSATITHDGIVQQAIPDASYPWDANGSGGGGAEGTLTDTISPGHSVTNPGGTFASGWQWHVTNASGHGGVDLNYNFQDFTAPGAGTVRHFDVAGVGMVVVLQLDTPAQRVLPQEPSGHDAYGPITAVWFEHCSAAVDGHHEEGEVIGTSGDGYGQYAPHLHVHGLTDNGNVAGTTNRAQFFSFVNGSAPPITGPDVYVPNVVESPVSRIDGVSAGGGVYLFTPEGFAEYMTIMQGAPWVTSGITDVRLVPSWAVGGGGDHAYTPKIPSHNPGDGMYVEAAAIPVFAADVATSTPSTTVLENWRDAVLGATGAGYYRKILTAPFTDLLVGNGDATRSFRPDQWHDAGLTFDAITGAAHGDPSIRLLPIGYNELGQQLGIDAPVGGSGGLAHSGWGAATSQVASNDLTPYLSAYSSHQTWITNQKNRELAQTIGLTKIQLDAGVQAIQTVLGGAQSAIGGAVSGGPSGAAFGAATALPTLATAGITASNAITMLDISTDGSFDIGAFQLGLSGIASLAAFDTWYQALTSNSGSGTPHRLASPWRAIVGQAFQAIVAVPSAERVRALLSEWNRYGYMIGQAFTPSRLDVMTRFTYWKAVEPVVLGAVPQQRRQTIAAAFERGTTVWGSISDIGTDVTESNAPLSGIAY